MYHKSYKIRLYPSKPQIEIINKTIDCARFIYNYYLQAKTEKYLELKDDKEKLYSHKYETEKELKVKFPFLKEASSRALQQARGDLDIAFKNYFDKHKKGKITKLTPEKFNKLKKKQFKSETQKYIAYHPDHPKFKSKRKDKWSYREPQIDYAGKHPNAIEVKNNKIKLNKLGWVKFKGLDKNFGGKICSVTIIKRKDGKYEASILVERDRQIKLRTGNEVVGIDLGLKEFIVCSNGETINGIKDHLFKIEHRIKTLQKHFSRKQFESNRREKLRIKIARLYQYKTDFQNHFFWHLANKLCKENQVIGIEDLNVKGMLQLRNLSHSIFYSGWSKFITMLKQKSVEYGTEVLEIDRFFPSSKMCSCCGQVKEDLTLSARIYECECGNKIDRDLNASINIRNFVLNKISAESVDYKHRETIRPKRLNFNFNGSFDEVLIDLVEKVA